MERIKAIETKHNSPYGPIKFRSRLEAKWALVFETLGIEYSYEPEGFDLGDGVYYLPDFYLPDAGYWVEVKGLMTAEDETKIEKFRDAIFNKEIPVGTGLYVVGNIPKNFDQYLEEYMRGDDIGIGYDVGHVFCRCEICGKWGIEFEGRTGRICGHKPEEFTVYVTDDEVADVYPIYKGAYLFDLKRKYGNWKEEITKAFERATQARFEHGEDG